MNANVLERLNPISVRVPKKLRDDLLKLSTEDKRSLSSFCRIIIEKNYRDYGRNTRYDKLKYKNENLVPLSFTITDSMEKKIKIHTDSCNRYYYREVTFSVFIRKVLSDCAKELLE